jgi:integrase
LDVLTPRRKQNYARLEPKEFPLLLRKIEAYNGSPVTRLAMKLMALTFVRTGELINAKWSEFDLEEQRWDIPAARMKMRSACSRQRREQPMSLNALIRWHKQSDAKFQSEGYA